jgi:hypothetical protein
MKRNYRSLGQEARQDAANPRLCKVRMPWQKPEPRSLIPSTWPALEESLKRWVTPGFSFPSRCRSLWRPSHGRMA